MSQPTKEAKLKWFDRLCDDAFGGLPIQAEGQAIRTAIEERGRLRKFIIRLLCLFGRHSPAKETLKLAAADGYELYGRQVSFCGRCRKILFIGYYPPEHPNCRCEIVDPRDEDSGLPAPKEIIHQAMEEWQKKEDEKWR